VAARQPDAPRAYFKGLNLLLNEQQDKAIDAFIEAVQNDPDTTDLHFALGNLFRRRGEFERAVRVHQHLLQRADLPPADRHRAQHALAQDFMKAGLFDRAEQAFRALDGSAYEAEARLALLMLYERSRDWRARSRWPRASKPAGTGSSPAAWRTTGANWRRQPTTAATRPVAADRPCSGPRGRPPPHRARWC
jgi:tetratricopeptide (TPR) repeat protein